MITTFSNGVQIINCTPHEIRFLDGEDIVTVEASGYKINATPQEQVVAETPCLLVKTVFVPSDEGRAELMDIKIKYPKALIVGSIISAQAYPGQVVGMTPAAGYERVPPSEKIMATDKFSIF